jgi:hypothetical protein
MRLYYTNCNAYPDLPRLPVDAVHTPLLLQQWGQFVVGVLLLLLWLE